MRARLGEYKVQFERNTKFFGISGAIKHEIDIVVFNDKERYAIELKYPVNGQYPEQMYSFVKDIRFMEYLKDYGFDGTYCLTMVKDKNFYSGRNNNGIYGYFRGNNILCGKINKPTGNSADCMQLEKEHQIIWEGTAEVLRYYIDKINKRA